MDDKRIRELVDLVQENDRLNGLAGFTDPRGNRRRQAAINQAHDQLADEFGRRRGWRRVTRGLFSLEGLARRVAHDRRGGVYEWPIDHPYYYREGPRAAAIAAHLYDINLHRPEVEELATKYTLVVELPTDFPSWWFPGHTTLVVFRPANQLSTGDTNCCG